DGLAQNLFGQPVGVDIGGVEERRAGLKRDIDEARRLLGLGVGPDPRGVAAAAESRSAEAEHRHLEAGPAEQTVFHADSPFRVSVRDAAGAPLFLRPALSPRVHLKMPHLSLSPPRKRGSRRAAPSLAPASSAGQALDPGLRGVTM